jgi:hypothetical protein
MTDCTERPTPVAAHLNRINSVNRLTVEQETT